MSSENLDLLEKQSLHVFAVLAIRAKRYDSLSVQLIGKPLGHPRTVD